jgi:ribosome biogenesis protein BRX1
MMDIMALLPHSKKDVKVQAKDNKADTLNELADLKGCSSCLLFECRKKKDLYMWLSKSPSGPSAKFLLKAVHTTEELKLTGNHLKGARPLLSFSSEFEMHPHLQLLKELLLQVFCTPKDHRKSKPFFDHVFTFSFLDNHIWFRNYQISVPHQSATNKIDRVALERMTLVEAGPRFAMNPIKIFSGSFGGQTLFENPFYVSPNAERSLEKRRKAGKYQKKVKAKQRRKTYESVNQLDPSELADVWDED